MNNVVAVSQSPLTPAGGGKLPAVVLPPGATQVLMVQPGGGSPAGAAYSPMAATAGVYPQLSPQQPPAVMWGQESMPIPSHQPEDVVMQVNRDLNGAEMGKIEQAGIEKPMTLCACVPGFSAHERERCAHYDHWPTVWAGHHASFLSGYPLLAFRMIFNLIPQFIICIMVIVDKAWVDKQFETKGIIVTDPQQKKAQEQYLFFLSNWTNMVQFFFFLHATFVTYVAIQKYSANNTGPVPCPVGPHPPAPPPGAASFPDCPLCCFATEREAHCARSASRLTAPSPPALRVPCACAVSSWPTTRALGTTPTRT